MSERIAILTGDLFADHHAKTAHGVIRYGVREVVAVIDRQHAGRTAVEVVPFCERAVPIVASVREAARLDAEVVLVGIAPTGGRLDPDLHTALLEAAEAGLGLAAGLHALLA